MQIFPSTCWEKSLAEKLPLLPGLRNVFWSGLLCCGVFLGDVVFGISPKHLPGAYPGFFTMLLALNLVDGALITRCLRFFEFGIFLHHASRDMSMSFLLNVQRPTSNEAPSRLGGAVHKHWQKLFLDLGGMDLDFGDAQAAFLFLK